MLSKSNIAEFSQDELQTLERQLLGFSLSAKPIIEILSSIESEATHKIFELSPEINLNQTIKIAAVVTDVRIVITRNSGQEMAFVKIDDGTGTIDLVVFPRLFKLVKSLLVDYKPVIVSGKVDSREEELSILADSIYSPGEEDLNGNEALITIPKDASTDQLRELKNLLLNNYGEKEVTLVFSGKNKKIKLPYKILWNESVAKQISSVLEGSSVSGVE